MCAPRSVIRIPDRPRHLEQQCVSVPRVAAAARGSFVCVAAAYLSRPIDALGGWLRAELLLWANGGPRAGFKLSPCPSSSELLYLDKMMDYGTIAASLSTGANQWLVAWTNRLWPAEIKEDRHEY